MSRAKKEQSSLGIYLRIASHLLDDINRLYDYDGRRDMVTITARTHAEGFSFLSKTLPSIGAHILASIDGGRFTPFSAFKADRDGCPLFLGGLIKRIFDFKQGGIVLSDPDVGAVDALHQLTQAFKKVKVPSTPKLEREAVEKYLQLEENYPVFQPGQLSKRMEKIVDNAICVLEDVLDGLDLYEITPKHGPGAVAGKERHAEKFIFFRDDRLFGEYPFSDYFQTGGSYLPDPLSWDMVQHHYDVRTRVFNDPIDSVGPSRMSLVPKTVSSLRVIQMEPKERQWIQQGQGRACVEWLEMHPLTRGHVNFSKQGVNRRLAMRGSRDGSLATLDWSEASDRVGARLVWYLLPNQISVPLFASRSTHVELPTGDIIPLNKFAGMGAATCFPVEALVFWALAVGTVAYLTGDDFYRSSRGVFVYGDDVIVPTRFAEAVMETGRSLGMKPSDGKCHFRGTGRSVFRESCGCDAFGGIDITPVRVRREPPSKWADSEEILGWVAMSNLFHKHGYWSTAAYTKAVVEQAIGGELPVSPEPAGYLKFTSFMQGSYIPDRIAKKPRRIKIKDGFIQLRCIVAEHKKSRSDPTLSESLLTSLNKPLHENKEGYATNFFQLSCESTGLSSERADRGVERLRWRYMPVTLTD
jgi:hypothetical protein